MMQGWQPTRDGGGGLMSEMEKKYERGDRLTVGTLEESDKSVDSDVVARDSSSFFFSYVQ